MTTALTRTPGRPIHGDAELLSVLVALGPLDDRKWNYLNLERREFFADRMLKVGWSSGERALVELARVLWKGHGTVDLGYIATQLDGRFFQAAVDAIAVRRKQDFDTAGADAIDRVLS